MIKKISLLIVPFLLSSCVSINYLSVKNNSLVDQNGRIVKIVGNPPLVCGYNGFSQTFSGYFMYQKNDGTIVLDDFGRGTIELMDNPVCRLGQNE